jgi:hypothetical protein
MPGGDLAGHASLHHARAPPFGSGVGPLAGQASGDQPRLIVDTGETASAPDDIDDLHPP